MPVHRPETSRLWSSPSGTCSIPLFSDAFFVAIAVTIMAGLTFATLLTMIVVPVLYATFFRVPYGGAGGSVAAAKPGGNAPAPGEAAAEPA